MKHCGGPRRETRETEKRYEYIARSAQSGLRVLFRNSPRPRLPMAGRGGGDEGLTPRGMRERGNPEKKQMLPRGFGFPPPETCTTLRLTPQPGSAGRSGARELIHQKTCMTTPPQRRGKRKQQQKRNPSNPNFAPQRKERAGAGSFSPFAFNKRNDGDNEVEDPSQRRMVIKEDHQIQTTRSGRRSWFG